MTTLIERNTTIPVKKSEIYSTAEDNQTAVDVHVLQGERPMAGDNMSLGRFRLDGIPAAPRGLPQIEVTFDIDANGIINVTARDKATGKEQKVVITASTNLNKSDIDRMVEEAKKHQSEDSHRKELVEARNNADSTVYQVEKQIKELGDKLPAADKTRIDEKIQEVKAVMQKDDLQVIRSKTEELTQMLGAVSAQANAQTPPPEQTGQQAPPPPDGDVVEGEFKET
jgi:molecular chaperone DnaK